ncbi:hypothetical protein ACJMK2_042598 [Sinanodonta woodiana]
MMSLERAVLVKSEEVDEGDGHSVELHEEGQSKSGDSSSTKSPGHKAKKKCPYFGVKSYLHDFYSGSLYKDPTIYEEEEDLRLLLRPRLRRRRCSPIWWKVFMWIGVNLLLFGIIGILVGYLVPQKSIFFKVDSDNNHGYIDRAAMAFNTTLDVCKLIGLILFCVGGMTLAMALLFPSFLNSYCDEDVADDTFKVRLGEEEKPPLSPVEMTIPATSKVKGVQPTRTTPESIATGEGVVEYKD